MRPAVTVEEAERAAALVVEAEEAEQAAAQVVVEVRVVREGRLGECSLA